MSDWRIRPSARLRWLSAAIVLFLGVQPYPSVAQQERQDRWGGPGNYETGFERARVVLNQCAERVRSTPDMQPDDCVDAVFRACEAEHGTRSQRDLNDCAVFSNDAWEKRLETIKARLLGAKPIDPESGSAEPMVERLRESNRRWEEWSRSDCELQAAHSAGGTMHRLELYTCLSNHAAHRALELEALAFWWERSFTLQD